MPEAVIVSSVRTPVGKAYKGSLRATRPDDLADGEPHQRRNLLRTLEIVVRRALESLALERDDALIAEFDT